MKNIYFAWLIFVLSSQFLLAQDQCCKTGCCDPPCIPDPPCIGCGDDESEADLIESIDPNDIIPPKGVGDEGWIRKDWILNFMVTFENLPEATAPAQIVDIRMLFNPVVDAGSFKVGDYGFGFAFEEVPDNSSTYNELLPYSEEFGVDINVLAGVNVNSSEAYWIFESYEPGTQLPPDDPLAGFLPPNDTITGEGEGFITFSITADQNSQTYDVIDVYAEIVFDENDPITTPMAFLTVDADTPVSQVIPEIIAPDLNTLLINWSGTDIGSGIRDYTLFVSENYQEYKLALVETTETHFLLPATLGNTYRLFTVARDSVDNLEVKDNFDVEITFTEDLLPVSCMDIVLPLDGNGLAEIEPADIIDGEFDENLYAGIYLDIFEFDCSHVGSNTVELTIEYFSNTSSTCTANVEIVDEVLPEALSQDITVELDENGEADVTADQVDNGSSDACGVASLSIDLDQFDCDDLGTHEVTLTVTDENGNEASSSSVVTIVDALAPIPNNSNLINLTAKCELSVTFFPKAMDNCSGEITATTSDPLYFSEQGTYFINWNYDDGNGNIASQTQTVIIDDTTPPVLTLPIDIAVTNDAGDCGAVVSFSVSSSDDCAGEVLAQTSGLASGSVFPVGTTVNSFEVTDVGGNVVSGNLEVTVLDIELPTIVCPADIFVCEGEVVNYTLSVGLDNCSVNTTQTDGSGYTDGMVFPVGVTLQEFTATDASGNVAVCSFNVTVYANPDLTIVEDELPLFCQGLATLTAEVNNPNLPLTYDWSGGLGASETETVYSNGTYFVTVTDGNGCQSTASEEVDVAAHEVLSGFVMIADEKIELKRSIVDGGGIGVRDIGGEAKLDDLSEVNTFVKADNIDITGGSSAALVIESNVDLTLPVFRDNNFNDNNHVTVQPNQTMTLTESNYGNIEVKENATLYFDNPEIFIKELKTKEGATIDFLQPGEFMVKGKLEIDKDNNFNPSGEAIIVYLKDKLDVKEHSNVQGVIYSKDKIETKGLNENNPTNMTGLFISLKEIKSDTWTNWNWTESCFELPPPPEGFGIPDDKEIAADLNIPILEVFPNPANNKVNIRLYGVEGHPELKIFDQFGKLIWSLQLEEQPFETDLELSDNQFVNGIYLVNVTSGDIILTKKLVIIK